MNSVNNKNYEFQDLDLSPEILSVLICKLFKGKRVQSVDVCREMLHYHLQNGGGKPKDSKIANKTFTLLRKKGFAKKIVRGIWLINDKTATIKANDQTINGYSPKERTHISSHSDLQAKIILIGNYLGFRTYTPNQKSNSIYGILGELCTEKKIPDREISQGHLNTVKQIDVIWFDEDASPSQAFEVECTTDITKGLLRLFQFHKLKAKMFIVSEEVNRKKFEREIQKNPFHKIQNEFIFKNFEELDDFFTNARSFNTAKQKFYSLQ
ncbi:MAG: hypothetical protein ABI855_13295 [Bacteroidota bacterium]